MTTNLADMGGFVTARPESHLFVAAIRGRLFSSGDRALDGLATALTPAFRYVQRSTRTNVALESPSQALAALIVSAVFGADALGVALRKRVA